MDVNLIKEIMLFSAIFFFVGYIFYSFVIDDKEPFKKHS